MAGPALFPFSLSSHLSHSILCHSFGAACHCGKPRLPHSHCLPLQLLLSLSPFTHSSPACHCGRSRLTFLFCPSHHPISPPLFLFLSSLAALRAPDRHGRSKVILLTLCHVESTSDSVGPRSSTTTVSSLGSLAALHSPDHELQWLAIAWLCFALIAIGTSWDVTMSLPSSFTPST